MGNILEQIIDAEEGFEAFVERQKKCLRKHTVLL